MASIKEKTVTTDSYGMNRKILRLAVPNIISNISVPLLGMVDLAIAGHLGDSSYIGAIAIATTIFNFIYWAFGFLRMGTSGLTAQAYGARNFREAADLISRAAVIAVIIAAGLLLLQSPIFSFSASIMNTSDKTFPLVLEYFFIRIWAAPATLMLYVFKGWFIGMQNSKTPMYIAIFINIVNIATSWFFAVEMNMGIAGVALGTVIAQYSGVTCFLFITNRYYRKVLRYINIRRSLDRKAMSKFFNVNRDIFLKTICLIVAYTFFTSASAKIDDETLAVNALLMQLFTLFSYIMDGFAYAAESLVGRFYGAANRLLLKVCVNKTILWGVLLGTIFTVAYGLFLVPILSIFTSDPALFTEAEKYLWWIVAVPFSGFFAFIFDGVMVGMTQTKVMRDTIFVALIGFFVVYYSLIGTLGNVALWMAFITFLVLRGVLQYGVYHYKLSK